jgi:hypothetical protein
MCGIATDKKDENQTTLNLGFKNEATDALVYVNFCEMY